MSEHEHSFCDACAEDDASHLAEQARLKARVETLEGVLKECEWRGHATVAQKRECFEQSGSWETDHFFCPICHAHDEDLDFIPHEKNCRLGQALAALPASATSEGEGHV